MISGLLIQFRSPFCFLTAQLPSITTTNSSTLLVNLSTKNLELYKEFIKFAMCMRLYFKQMKNNYLIN